MQSDITGRFIDCYRYLKEIDKIKSDRQFCFTLQYTPQSWNKILKGEREITLALLQNAVDKFDFNPSYILSGEGDLIRRDCENKEQIKTGERNRITHLPISAKAGFLEQINEQVFEHQLDSYDLPGHQFNFGEFRSFEVEGDSMEPTLYQGEIIICSKVEDPNLWKFNIKSGYVYVLVSKNDLVVKRIVNRLKDDNQLLLASDNSNYNDIILNSEDIKEIWMVKMKLTSFAHSKLNFKQEINSHK